LRLTKDDSLTPVLLNMDLVLEVLEHGPGGSVLSLTNGATLNVSESLDDIARLLASPPPPRPFGADDDDDSPKRQGDTLANSRDIAAGRPKKNEFRRTMSRQPHRRT
jgi:hypothetical protein